MTEDGRKTGTLKVGTIEFVLSEPTAWDLERFDDAAASIEVGKSRPFETMKAMIAVVHACLVSPQMDMEKLKKSLTRQHVINAFGLVMKLGGSEDSGKGEAGSA